MDLASGPAHDLVVAALRQRETAPQPTYPVRRSASVGARMRAFHGNWFWVAVDHTGQWACGARAWRLPSVSLIAAFPAARAVAFAAMSIQIAAGLVLWGRGIRPGNGFHVFYGIVIVVTFSFAYLYVRKWPTAALAYGLLLLFVMGLGFRAWSNVTL